MTKRAIVREYLTKKTMTALKEGKTAKKTLAKKIFEENPGGWDNEELVRTEIRKQTGASGGSIKVRPEHEFVSNPKLGVKQFKLPKSQAKLPKNFIFPDGLDLTLVISDIHIPYHDNDSLTAVVEFGKNIEVDSVFINGDLFDFYQGSDFDKDPRNFSIDKELRLGYEFIMWLRQEFPGIPIFFKLGNHELRFERLLQRKVPQLVGIEELELSRLLELRNFGVEVIAQDRLTKYGKLNIVHGHEFKYGVYSPVSAAKGIYNKAHASTLVGHWHHTSEHGASNLNGEAIGTWSTGCLCSLRPEYSPFAFTHWNHGFAILTKEPSGKFHVDNRRIRKGVVL